jgi:AraC-like DNA-binding protein
VSAHVLSSMSTVGIDEAERLAFWEHYNAEALVGLTCRTYEAEGLLARQVNLGLGAVRVADISGNPHVIERSPGLVRSRPKEATFVSLLLEGEGFFYHSGGCLTVAAGDVVVYSTDRPYLFGFGRAMRQLLIDVPQGTSEGRGLGVEPAGPRLIAGTGRGAAAATARALRELLLGALTDPVATDDLVGEQVLDLIEAMGSRGGTAWGSAQILAATTYVAEHLQDPGLCADAVGRAVGVTARHLNRAFAAEGTTVTQLIQTRRLDRARQDLRLPAGQTGRVADVASRWGFASQAHFSRLFKTAYGCTPNEYRSAQQPAS